MKSKTKPPNFQFSHPTSAHSENESNWLQHRQTDSPPGQLGPPSYQAEVFNPFVGQPVPPGHRHAAGAGDAALCTVLGTERSDLWPGQRFPGRRLQGSGGGPRVKGWTESRGRAAGLHPGSHRAAALPPHAPWPSVPPLASPFVSREPVVVAAVQDVPGGKVEASLAASSLSCPAADNPQM